MQGNKSVERGRSVNPLTQICPIRRDRHDLGELSYTIAVCLRGVDVMQIS